MALKETKERPAGVPAENVYDKMHWTVVVGLIATAVALYFVINAG